MSGTPAAFSAASARPMSATRTQMWCRPGPRWSRKRSSPALPRGAMSSMFELPTGRRAAWVAGASGCGDDPPRLELTVTALQPAGSLDVLVRDQDAGRRILNMPGQTVPPGRLGPGGTGVQLVVWFSRPGRYLVHVVARQP